MKRVAITGNIGSGKTWVSQLFAERLGIPVFDSDRETKLLYGRPDVVEAMQARFGDGLYAPDGTLHNARLAQLLFDDPEALRFVEQLLYPLLFDRFEAWADDYAATKPYVLFESAIVLEKHLESRFDAVVMVTASEATRLRRVMLRNRCSEAVVRQRMALQWPDERKCALADFVITHEADDEDAILLRQIRRVHRSLCRITPLP